MARRKVTYMEVVVVGNIQSGRSRIYSSVTNPPSQMSTQFLGPKNDMECLVNKGLKDIPWFKRFLENTSMKNILDYAEKKITENNRLKNEEKLELLEIIQNHEVRVFEKK